MHVGALTFGIMFGLGAISAFLTAVAGGDGISPLGEQLPAWKWALTGVYFAVMAAISFWAGVLGDEQR